MIWRRRSSLVVSYNSNPRRGVTPMTLLVLMLAAGIGFIWYQVFSPLFDDPRDWAGRERAFRTSIHEILKGASAVASVAPDLNPWPTEMSVAQRTMISRADAELARGVRLSVRYHAMSYPWGDLPDHLAASADLIIRCLRSVGLDLQQMIHHDRTNHPDRYPLHLWSSKKADKSIDHRRLPNLHAFVRHFAESKSVLSDSEEKRASFQPGDLVFWTPGGGGAHPGLAGIVLDRRDERGYPLVMTVTNEDGWVTDHHPIHDWPITGHYRIAADRLLEQFLEENPSAELLPRGS